MAICKSRGCFDGARFAHPSPREEGEFFVCDGDTSDLHKKGPGEEGMHTHHQRMTTASLCLATSWHFSQMREKLGFNKTPLLVVTPILVAIQQSKRKPSLVEEYTLEKLICSLFGKILKVCLLASKIKDGEKIANARVLLRKES